MRFTARTFFLLSIVLAAVVGGTFSAHYLGLSFIGLDPSGFPAGSTLQAMATAISPDLNRTVGGVMIALVPLLLLTLVGGVGVYRLRRAPRSGVDPQRRSLLGSVALGTGAALTTLVAGGTALFGRTLLGVGNGGRGWDRPLGEIFGGQVVKTHPEWKAGWKGSRVQEYGRLGRTEWPVSDTVLGTGSLVGEKGTKIVRLALERGVNYIDTAPDYAGSGSEQAVGAAIADFPRDSIFLATKFCSPIGHMPTGTSVPKYKEVIEESLGRLGTDYVDLAHVHSCNDVARLEDPYLHEAFSRVRAEGKVRFLGFSSHTPDLPIVANAAIDSGQYDVMMLAYHHGIWPGIPEIITRASREQDMGVVAMKTLKGAKHHGLKGFAEESDSYAQAALKWARSNPAVSCAVISFFETQHVDEYLYASGQRVTDEELAVLEKYDRLIQGSYCPPQCGACLSSCPEALPINDILRHRMYFEDYGSERKGMELYARLERNASICAQCSAPCQGSCPLGIPIQEKLVGAHELLSLL